MGKRTSVYLSDELAEAVRASGVGPAELIRRGLDVSGPALPEVEKMRQSLELFGKLLNWFEKKAAEE